ncbi:MAG TPA: hypothetical protein VNF49_08295 [Candidatus Binataceae bacterium]|nr:hypothetical protein [Candidatus Binataceae bacterium]
MVAMIAIVAVVAVVAIVSMVAIVSTVAMIAVIAMVAVTPVMLPPVTITPLRDVDVVIPTVLHKIDRTIARVILPAVLPPVTFIARRHVQVNRRRRRHPIRPADGNQRPCEYQLRGRYVAEINLPEQAGLVDRNRYADIAGERVRAGTDGKHRNNDC